MRRTGGDQHGLAREILRDTKPLQGFGDNLFRIGKPAGAHHSASQVSVARLDDVYASLPQDLQVGLRRRMLPHIHVHRRSKDDRSFGCEIKRAEEVVGNALRKLCNSVSRGRSHQQTVNGLRD